MRKLLLATSALAFCGSAMAADLPARLPLKAPVVAPVPFSWTGCYVGAEGGYGWGHTDFGNDLFNVFAPAGVTIGDRTKGGLAGGQLGCNYQFAGNWVVGIEGDYDWANIRGTANDPFFGGKNGRGPAQVSSRTDALASVTGRLGYAFDRVLIYGKGGGAWSHNKYNMALYTGFLGFGPANPYTGSDDRFGWTAGAGIEYALTDRWSVKIEYDHYDFGSRTVGLSGVGFFGPGTIPAGVRQNIDTVKAGINYRFWSAPGPILARY